MHMHTCAYVHYYKNHMYMYIYLDSIDVGLIVGLNYVSLGAVGFAFGQIRIVVITVCM